MSAPEPHRTGPAPLTDWRPDRAAAQARLEAFLPWAGSAYARRRNFDQGPDRRSHISALSPWLRHRCLLEQDVLRQTLSRHSFTNADKFVQEVFWRGYFKGWLEHRPGVWSQYKQALLHGLDHIDKQASLAEAYQTAIAGRSGIACFDAWAEELIRTGYLHNHARMWFASIWIFTLKLPWELGADFFYRHLLDGDPASNTCSWRWVAGLHTIGKTYLARPDNIQTFTEGRFYPEGQLAMQAPALTGPKPTDPVSLKFDRPDLHGLDYGLLITEEDCSPDQFAGLQPAPAALLALNAATPRSVLPSSDLVRGFASQLVADAAQRAERHFGQPCPVREEADWSRLLTDWAGSQKLDAIVTARTSIGPVRKRLYQALRNQPVPLIELTRPYDQLVWPHARKGFFGLKKKIPELIRQLDL